MTKFEKVWFGQNLSYLGLNSSLSSDSMGVDSFWGLFLIAGVVHLLLSAYAWSLSSMKIEILWYNWIPQLQYGEKLKPWQPALITRTSAPILSEKVKWEIEVASMAWMQDQATPASEYGDPMSPNGQTSPVTAFGIDLANSNQEPKGVPEVVHVNN
ncbi:hypothetical protein AAG906_017344 [Vitis piasezkii]